MNTGPIPPGNYVLSTADCGMAAIATGPHAGRKIKLPMFISVQVDIRATHDGTAEMNTAEIVERSK